MVSVVGPRRPSLRRRPPGRDRVGRAGRVRRVRSSLSASGLRAGSHDVLGPDDVGGCGTADLRTGLASRRQLRRPARLGSDVGPDDLPAAGHRRGPSPPHRSHCRPKRSTPCFRPPPTACPRTVPTDAAAVVAVRHALGNLPDEQRRVVLLASLGGHTAVEIAEREGIPIGTAKSRLRLGLARLRTELAGSDRRRDLGRSTTARSTMTDLCAVVDDRAAELAPGHRRRTRTNRASGPRRVVRAVPPHSSTTWPTPRTRSCSPRRRSNRPSASSPGPPQVPTPSPPCRGDPRQRRPVRRSAVVVAIAAALVAIIGGVAIGGIGDSSATAAAPAAALGGSGELASALGRPCR